MKEFDFGLCFFIWLKWFILIELLGVNENVGGLILALSFSERAGWLIASSPSSVGLQFVFIAPFKDT